MYKFYLKKSANTHATLRSKKEETSLYLWLQADDLSLLPDEASVADGQTIQQIHQHNHNQEDKGNEQKVADRVGTETKQL